MVLPNSLHRPCTICRQCKLVYLIALSRSRVRVFGQRTEDALFDLLSMQDFEAVPRPHSVFRRFQVCFNILSLDLDTIWAGLAPISFPVNVLGRRSSQTDGVAGRSDTR